MSQYNPKEFWNSAAQDPDVRYKYIADEWATTEKFIEIIGNANESWGKVLEIGCGIGRLLDPLSDKYETCQFYGIDISPEMLKLAPKKPNITYSEKIETAELDMVYSMLVFQHIPDEAKIDYLQSAYAVLKKGGVLFFQFVVGEEYTPYSYQSDPYDMLKTVQAIGFRGASINTGVIHQDWAFLKATK